MPEQSVIQSLLINQLKPNPWNRTVFDPQALVEFAMNLNAEGIKERLKVRPLADGNYEITSGHRRWLAAQKAGLTEVPCEIVPMSDEQVAQDNIALNVQREQIPPLELARMVNDYIEKFNKTQDDAANKFGKDRTWATKLLGFLKIDPTVRGYVSALTLSWDSLDALKALPIEAQTQVAQELKDGKLKPEQVAKRCAELGGGKKKGKGKAPKSGPPDPFGDFWPTLVEKLSPSSPETWRVVYTPFKTMSGEQMAWTFAVFNKDEMVGPKRLAAWFRAMAQGIDGANVPNPGEERQKEEQTQEAEINRQIEEGQKQTAQLADITRRMKERGMPTTMKEMLEAERQRRAKVARASTSASAVPVAAFSSAATVPVPPVIGSGAVPQKQDPGAAKTNPPVSPFTKGGSEGGFTPAAAPKQTSDLDDLDPETRAMVERQIAQGRVR